MYGTQAPIPYDGKVILYKENGNTGDIISAIKAGDAMSIDYVRDFAESMRGTDVAETCANLWYFLKSNVPFIEDKGKQVIQLPGAVYENRYASLGGTGAGADCKSFSLFCSSVLRALGNYDFMYRFISETAGSPVHHVYLIVQTTGEDGTQCYIPLDCTLENFAVEVNYVTKKDMAPTHPVDAPHVGEFNLIKVGGIGTTVQEAEDSYFEFSEKDFQKNLQSFSHKINAGCVRSIKNQWLPAHPIKFSLTLDIFEKHWEDLVTMASAAIYHYWNDNTIISYSLCQADSQHAQNIPFPANYAEKRSSADAIVDGFKKLGLRDFDIIALVTLGTWRKYGCTFEYMLYRCYCLELYGQPFKPHPGVPYWNNTTGVFINNGADLGDSFNIVLCFPAQGGVGRPFGQPYWSLGGNVILNGSTKPLDVWLSQNPRPGTPIDGDTQNLVPGVIANNGAGISIADQNAALIIYNRWAKGNMVMLPQPDFIGKGKPTMGRPAIGYLPIGEIVTIVVAVVSAVVTITTLIIKIVEMFKHPDDASKIALPTQDFKWDYQTADGCIIGHCAALGGCNGATTVKMCNGQITEVNPDMNNPDNQPPDPGGFFSGPEGKKKLLLGTAAVTALGAGLLLMSND